MDDYSDREYEVALDILRDARDSFPEGTEEHDTLQDAMSYVGEKRLSETGKGDGIMES